MRCLVRLIRSIKFLDRQCVRLSLKVSGGMLKTNYDSNACLLLETDLRWLLWRLGLLGRALKLALACCFFHKTLIKVTKSPLPTLLVFTQNKEATHPRIGLGLGSLMTPSKTPSPLIFSGYIGLNTHGRYPCSRENLAGTF